MFIDPSVAEPVLNTFTAFSINSVKCSLGLTGGRKCHSSIRLLSFPRKRESNLKKNLALQTNEWNHELHKYEIIM